MTTPSRHVTVYYAPRSRSLGVRMLVEELQADHELHILDLQKNQQREPAYLAINPLGKVPALRHGDAVVTEQAAIYLYLAELYPEAGLSPAVGDPLRGAYLRWMVLYGSCFEPALVDQAFKRAPVQASTSPYGDYGSVVKLVNDQLRAGPWLLGERYTAADVLWGAALGWTTAFGIMPMSPEVQAYLDRFNVRPAVQRAHAAEAVLVAQVGT